MRELVLYYTPSKSPQTAKLKDVLVRMGIRIRNVTPDQLNQKIGHLAGVPGYEASGEPNVPGYEASAEPNVPGCEASGEPNVPGYEASGEPNVPGRPDIPDQEVLVLHLFTGSRLDELLRNLKAAGVRIALKAVVTESNCDWTFCELYEELLKEHASMHAQRPTASQAPSRT